jgi:RNA polymerase sigma-70 factor (ECF subfamily)
LGAGEVALGSAEGALQVAEQADAALVAACRSGDAHAFERLVAIHEGMVFNLAARLLGDLEEARDLSQEVFLQVYRQLARFEGRSALRTWIYRIVVNQCRNRQRSWRRRARERSLPLEALAASSLEPRIAETSGPYEQARLRERAERLQEALERLSFEHRAVLLLREVESLSCEEVAVALGLPEGTVKSRLARAREALRRELLPFLDREEAQP